MDYQILSVDAYQNKRLTIVIHIDKKLSEAALETAAKEIYIANQGAGYARVFILWYLPGMKKDEGAWASTHFNPILKIEIMDWILEYNPTTLKK